MGRVINEQYIIKCRKRPSEIKWLYFKGAHRLIDIMFAFSKCNNIIFLIELEIPSRCFISKIKKYVVYLNNK